MLCCAHAIFYFLLQGQEQDSFLVHENVYLVDAEDFETALAAGIEFAKSEEDLSEDGHLRVNEQKVSYIFAGIRKIIDVSNTHRRLTAPDMVGLESTYSVFEVDNLDQVLALARGEMVEVLYRE